MCVVCGCEGSALTHLDGAPARDHDHGHDHGHGHRHGDGHEHAHAHGHRHEAAIDYGSFPAGLHVAGLSQARTIRIERDILAKNAAYAAQNRARLRRLGTLGLNVVSSPGSGKTSLLARIVSEQGERWPIAVIEGDQQTSHDAERIRAAGGQAVQVNTGKGCHLDAHMVGHAMDRLDLAPGGLLFIENVGNLVCPAAFDLGEAHKVVVLSTTEGEDKPLKYPDMFAASDLMLLNKSDLLPYLEFDVPACVAAARRVNPRIEVLTVSARTGQGMAGFYAWMAARAPALAPCA